MRWLRRPAALQQPVFRASALTAVWPRPCRFIVKSLSKQEKASFLEFAPAYFAYMARSMRAGGRPTCLAKVWGTFPGRGRRSFPGR
jgi:hypothetical protein